LRNEIKTRVKEPKFAVISIKKFLDNTHPSNGTAWSISVRPCTFLDYSCPIYTIHQFSGNVMTQRYSWYHVQDKPAKIEKRIYSQMMRQKKRQQRVEIIMKIYVFASESSRVCLIMKNSLAHAHFPSLFPRSQSRV
jgi:hypothetical protein